MPLFRCTERLRRAIGLATRDLTSSPPTAGTVEWYCNLLHIERRKCLLFTHPPTLFSFLVPFVRKADLQRLGDTFREHLSAALAAEGLDPLRCLPPLAEQPDAFAKTLDRSTLGSMRDHQLNLKWYVAYDGGWERVTAAELTRRLNDTPMGFRDRKDLEYPREIVREWLTSAGVEHVPPAIHKRWLH